MRRIKLLFLGLVLLGIGRAAGQGTSLRIFLKSTTDTFALLHQQFDTIPIYITNDSATTFYGSISMSSTINGVVADSVDDNPAGDVYYPGSAESDSIAQGDTILRYLVVTGKNPPIIQGPNGLVVWPIVTVNNNGNHLVNIEDSIRLIVIFAYGVGINQPNNKNLKVYMLGQQLLIQGDGEHLLKSLVLYDLTGKAVQQQTLSIDGVVNMAPYADGIYLAEITFADNTRQVFKVLNTR